MLDPEAISHGPHSTVFVSICIGIAERTVRWRAQNHLPIFYEGIRFRAERVGKRWVFYYEREIRVGRAR